MILFLATVFILYVGYIWSTYGVLSSISASSYLVPKWQFTLWLVIMGLGCYWIDPSVWTAYMGIGFVIIGNTPEHKRSPDSAEDDFHLYGTLLAILSGFAGLFIEFGLWQPHVVMIIGTGLLYWRASNWIWWVEVLAMATIVTGYYIALN